MIYLSFVIKDTGSLKDGSKSFDSTLDRGEPFMCKLGHGQVIRGIQYNPFNSKVLSLLIHDYR